MGICLGLDDVSAFILLGRNCRSVCVGGLVSTCIVLVDALLCSPIHK